jgi:hypothetical protein
MKPTRTHTPRPDGRPACGVRGDTATAPEHVDCLRCRRTAWWAAGHDTMPRTLVMWPARGSVQAQFDALTDDEIIDYACDLLDGHRHTERVRPLRWLLTHPEAPIRWRLASGRIG